MMRILLYTKEGDETSAKRMKILESNFKDRRVETPSTVDDLIRRLREPSEETKILILLINNREDLKYLLSIPHLFLNVPLVIQVPDDSPETMQMAHRLRPRYLNSPQDDLGALVEVLRRILNNIKEYSGGAP